MEEKNNIDQLFKQGVHQHFPVDEKLWAAVETQLPTTSNSGITSLWFFNLNTLALLMVLTICAIIPTDNVRTSVIAKSDSLSKLSSPTVLPSLDETIESKTDEVQLTSTDNTTISEMKPDNQNIIPVDPVNTSVLPVTENASSSKNEIESSTYNTIIDKNVIKSSSAPSAIDTKNKSTVSNLTANPNGLIAITSKEDINDATKKMENNKNYSKPNENRFINSSSDEPSFSFIQPLGLMKMNDNITNGTPFNKRTLNLQPKKLFYNVELEALISVSSEKHLSGANESFITYKEENETSLEHNNYGLNFVSQHKFLTYGFGVHYSKYSERVSYTTPKETQGFTISYDTTYNLVNGSFNSNGVPVFLIEQTITENRDPAIVIVDENLITTNTFKRLRVPVFAGLQKNYNNWLAEIRTAFVFNYLTDVEGVQINRDLNRVENFNSETHFNKMVYSHKSDLSIGYTINELIAVGARFNYEYDINSFTKQYNSKLQNQRVGIWLMWRPL